MSQSFDTVVILCIIVSSLNLAMEKPGISDDEKATFATMDLVFMIVFTVEMVIKICASGFIWVHDCEVVRVTPGEISYLSSHLLGMGYARLMDEEDEFDKYKRLIVELEQREVELVPMQPYLANPWNRLDITVILVAYLDLILEDGSFLRVLRLLRCMRCPYMVITAL